jgi:hypothetical protein
MPARSGSTATRPSGPAAARPTIPTPGAAPQTDAPLSVRRAPGGRERDEPVGAGRDHRQAPACGRASLAGCGGGRSSPTEARSTAPRWGRPAVRLP